MSKSFFESLGIPNPDINLEIGSGSHAERMPEEINRLVTGSVFLSIN